MRASDRRFLMTLAASVMVGCQAAGPAGTSGSPPTPDSVSATASTGFNVKDALLPIFNAVSGTSTLPLTGTDGNDTLTDGKLDKLILGRGGDDTLKGDGGNDTIDGGPGTDVSVYSGPASGYEITIKDSNARSIVVKDTDPSNGDEGTDVLTNIEVLRFTSGDMPLVWVSGSTVNAIASAVATAAPGSTVLIPAGTYPFTAPGNVTALPITAHVNLIGAGMDKTKLVGSDFQWDAPRLRPLSGDAGINLAAAASGSAAAPLILQDFTLDSFTPAINASTPSPSTALHHVTMRRVTTTRSGSSGQVIETGLDFFGVPITDFLLTDSKIDNALIGLAVQHTSAATPVAFDRVTLRQTSFTNDTNKGIYVEALSNAVLDGLSLTRCGTFGRPVGSGPEPGILGAGIDINLKYGNYSQVALTGVTMTQCGQSTLPGYPADPNGAALMIKARDDAPSYASSPATLSGVTVKSCKIIDSSVGVRVGEMQKWNAGPAVAFDLNTFQNLPIGLIGVARAASSLNSPILATVTTPIAVNGSALSDLKFATSGSDTLTATGDKNIFVFDTNPSPAVLDTIVGLNLNKHRLDLVDFWAGGGKVKITAATATTTLTGATLSAAVNTLLTTGALQQPFTAGLYKYGGQTYLIASGKYGGTAFGSDDAIVQVTGVTGTLDANDLF